MVLCNEEADVNMYERQVVVDDGEGRAMICTLEHKCSEFVCRLDSNRKLPRKIEELSEHERDSCKRFIERET